MSTTSPESSRPRRRNVRTRQFKELFDRLPERIQALARDAYRLFLENPDHPALERHPLNDKRKSRHRSGSVAIIVTRRYRAIYVEDGNDNVWYWIGSHEDYNSFTGSRRG